MVAQPKKIPKSGQHSLQASDGDGHSANDTLWLESLSIRPGMFPEFPTGNFA